MKKTQILLMAILVAFSSKSQNYVKMDEARNAAVCFAIKENLAGNLTSEYPLWWIFIFFTPHAAKNAPILTICINTSQVYHPFDSESHRSVYIIQHDNRI